MVSTRRIIMFLAFMILAGSAFGPAWGAGAGAASSEASLRGPVALPLEAAPATAGSRLLQNPPASKNADGAVGASNKVALEIIENPGLTLKLQPLLPKDMTLDTASNGFKNPRQFVAALHISLNLKLPFDQLKAKIVTDKLSLGDAIQALKPGATKNEVNAEVKKAEAQAKDDMKKA